MPAPPFKVKAVYDYSSPHDDDLDFSTGQIITVTEEEDAEWYIGEYTGSDGVQKNGLFPRNFVDRYEPQAPPRPTRSRPKTGPQLESEAALPAAQQAEPEPPHPVKHNEDVISEQRASAILEEAPPAPKPQPAQPAVVATSAKAPPPETASKPSSGSFKDRIAAFNKPAAPPVAPKPSGASAGQNFIKKPFVAPPPARNAYVPPASKSDAPQKIYRREEDPEIAEKMAQNQKEAEEVGVTRSHEDELEEEAPRATSLKDRIALLQKQQQEQTARRAEGGPKPKRPTQPRTESDEATTKESPTKQDDVKSPERATRTSSDVARPMPGRMPSGGPETDESLRDMVSDGNEADQSGAGETTEDAGGDSTEVEEMNERPQARTPAVPFRTFTGGSREAQGEAEELEEEQDVKEGEEQEEDIDPETLRKEELRARMAKMSGGMGMPGMFGMPPPRPPTTSRKSTERRSPSTETRSPPPQQRIPMVPMPGVPSRVQSPPLVEDQAPRVEKEAESAFPIAEEQPAEAVPDVEDVSPRTHEQAHPEISRPPAAPQDRPLPRRPSAGLAPPVPDARTAPEPRGRTVPPPPFPPRASVAEDSDADTDTEPGTMSRPEAPLSTERSMPLPPPPIPGLQANLAHRSGAAAPGVNSAQSPPDQSQVSPSANEKRASRAPPMSAGSPQIPPMPAQERPFPPPPPSAVPPRRQASGRQFLETPITETAERDSEYEGDYDTDIAPTATHKDALKARVGRDTSQDGDSTLSESTMGRSPMTAPPPVPNLHRAVPPPPPHQTLPSKKSTETSRGPPPIPPPRTEDDEEYDPYRYDGLPAPSSRTSTGSRDPSGDVDAESLTSLESSNYRGPPPMPPTGPPPPVHSAPPPVPPEHRAPMAVPSEDSVSLDEPRRSLNPSRKSTTGRRSMDPGSRAQADEGGHIARDVDLAEATMWWTQARAPPPSLQNRTDVLTESEESATSKRGGRSTTSKDIYVLFQDYSQTIITVQYDARDPSHDVHLEQRHEAPPPKMRQDQLEAMYVKHGEAIAAAASTRLNQTVEDGTAQGLVRDLFMSAGPNVLQPIGTRAYGALVYYNMANSSVSQYDEIRPGDIVSFKNAKFKGKHGNLHTKYSMDVGKPDHVAVVMEWDGTKKKIRALEQGREKEGKKAKIESFRVGDLGGGEVKVWRAVGRDYVGWESNA